MKTGAQLTAHIMQRVAETAGEKKWAAANHSSVPFTVLFAHFQLKLGKRPSNIIFNRCPVSLFVFLRLQHLLCHILVLFHTHFLTLMFLYQTIWIRRMREKWRRC